MFFTYLSILCKLLTLYLLTIHICSYETANVINKLLLLLLLYYYFDTKIVVVDKSSVV